MALGTRAKKLGAKAAERVMQNERAVAALMQAIARAQAGKQAIDRFGDGVLHALGFAARGDYKAIGRRISGLKRRLRELSVKLDSLS